MQRLVLLTFLMLSGCTYSTNPIFTEQDNGCSRPLSNVCDRSIGGRYPDSATGASDPIGAVPVDRPVVTPEVEPMESSLKISVLKAGADQADWLKEIDATGEIIYGYEIVVR